MVPGRGCLLAPCAGAHRVRHPPHHHRAGRAAGQPAARAGRCPGGAGRLGTGCSLWGTQGAGVGPRLWAAVPPGLGRCRPAPRTGEGQAHRHGGRHPHSRAGAGAGGAVEQRAAQGQAGGAADRRLHRGPNTECGRRPPGKGGRTWAAGGGVRPWCACVLGCSSAAVPHQPPSPPLVQPPTRAATGKTSRTRTRAGLGTTRAGSARRRSACCSSTRVRRGCVRAVLCRPLAPGSHSS